MIKHKIKITFCMIIISFLMYKNRDFNIADDLLDYTDKYCTEDQDCLVDIRKVTPFKWDILYVFNMRLSSSYVDDIIGIPHEWKWSGENFVYRFAFVRDNKVVYTDEYIIPWGPFSEHRRLLKSFSCSGREERDSCVFHYYLISNDNANVFMRFHGGELSRNKDYQFFPANDQQMKDKYFMPMY